MPFTFLSNIARIVLWAILILVLILDAYGLWVILSGQAQVAAATKIIMLLGVALKIAILICLIFSKGPIKPLVYIWGGLFAVSGSMGLLSYMLSTQVEPVQAYFDKALYLFAGVVLIKLARKYILIHAPQETNKV